MLPIYGSWNRTFLFAGATMGWTMGRAGNRGFGPSENDLGVVGELFADPNAATHARGNLFSDRQYTVKIAGVQRFAHDVRVGAIARYQDGQAFSRMVVIPDLNQGAEAIRLPEREIALHLHGNVGRARPERRRLAWKSPHTPLPIIIRGYRWLL